MVIDIDSEQQQETLVDRWSERPHWDGLIGTLVGIAAWLVSFTNIARITTTQDQRVALYSSVVAFGAALLAFVVVPAAIVGGLSPTGRLQAVIRRHGHELSFATTIAGIAAIVLMVLSIIALGVDTDVGFEPIRYVVLSFPIGTLLAALRVLEFLRVLMSVHHRDDADPLRSKPIRPPQPRSIKKVDQE